MSFGLFETREVTGVPLVLGNFGLEDPHLFIFSLLALASGIFLPFKSFFTEAYRFLFEACRISLLEFIGQNLF